MSGADIAVIIVNYNTAQLTLEGIESVLGRSHPGHQLELHVVDNASPNGDASVLSAALKAGQETSRVRLWCEPENHGFGRANNLVLKELRGRVSPPKYVFLLNPDARLENEAISILADFLDAHPQVAVAGAGIAKPDGSPVTAAFRFPGVVSTLEAALSLGPVSRLLEQWRVPLPANLTTQRVDWVAGAAVMLRLEALERAGDFDPGYFLYFEEVDLMRRLTEIGEEVWCVSEARVIHAEGAATGVRSGASERLQRPTYWYQSWRHYFQKNHGRGYALAAAAAWIFGAAGNELIARLRGRTPGAPLRFYRDFWGAAVLPLLGLKQSSDD